MTRNLRKLGRHAADVRIQPWSHLRVWTFCAGVLMLLYGLARDPQWVEQTYVDGFGGTITSWLGWLTSPIPFSVAEVLLVVLVLYEVITLLTAVSEVGAGRRRWHNALVSGALHLVDLALLFTTWFYLAWGVAYARPSAEDRFDLPTDRIAAMADDRRAALLRSATLRSIERVNEAYLELHGSADAGVVTEPREGLVVEDALERAFYRLSLARDLGEDFGEPRGELKVPFGSPVLSWLGIGGIYVPFTGEATINGGPPEWYRVATASHEKSHQRMVTSEDAATFVGFLALVHSDEPLLRYVGWQVARQQLQRALGVADREALASVQGKLLPGPQRDLLAMYAYWTPYEGPLQDVHGAVNDAYLTVNAVEGGIESYGRAALLIAAWTETAEGRSLLYGGTGALD